MTEDAFGIAVQVEASPTGSLDRLVKKKLARGVNVARLNRGDIDHPPPDAAMAAAEAAVRAPELAQYTSNAGLPELRAEVASWCSEFGARVGADEVAITNGAKHALWLAFRLILPLGSEVILPTPHWPTLAASVVLAGGSPVAAPMTGQTESPLKIHHLESVVSRKTRALVLVNPDNPTGRCTDSAMVDEICTWAHERGMWVILDETYAGLEFESSASTRRGPRGFGANVIRVGAVSKALCVPGWRVGWLVGPPELVATGSAVHSHTVSHVSNVAQMGGLGALRARADFMPRLVETLRTRRDSLCDGLEGVDGVRLVRPAGGIHCFADVRDALGHLRYSSTSEMAEQILETHQVAVLPGEAFGAPGWLRLSFGGTEDEIKFGADRLRAALTGRGLE